MLGTRYQSRRGLLAAGQEALLAEPRGGRRKYAGLRAGNARDSGAPDASRHRQKLPEITGTNLFKITPTDTNVTFKYPPLELLSVDFKSPRSNPPPSQRVAWTS